MRLILTLVLLAAQLFVSLFYMSAALAMWGPFMLAPAMAKVSAGAIFVAPLLGFLVANERVRIPGLGTLAALGLVTAVQLGVVLVFVTTSQG